MPTKADGGSGGRGVCRTGLSARMMPGRALGARPRRARRAYRRALCFQFVGAPLGWACERGLDRRCFFLIQFLFYFIIIFIILLTRRDRGRAGGSDAARAGSDVGRAEGGDVAGSASQRASERGERPTWISAKRGSLADGERKNEFGRPSIR